MLAAVPAETAASHVQAEEDVWWAAALAIGGVSLGSLGLFLAHRLTKPPRIARGVQ